MTSVTSEQPAGGMAERRTLALIMLVLVYTFNFLDRQIVGILAVPIKADLGLSDSQLGLMGGLAFEFSGLDNWQRVFTDPDIRSSWLISLVGSSALTMG